MVLSGGSSWGRTALPGSHLPCPWAAMALQVEKDEDYIRSVVRLGALVEDLVKQNNAINIYEEYFAGGCSAWTGSCALPWCAGLPGAVRCGEACCPEHHTHGCIQLWQASCFKPALSCRPLHLVLLQTCRPSTCRSRPPCAR